MVQSALGKAGCRGSFVCFLCFIIIIIFFWFGFPSGAAPYGWNLGKVVVGRLPAGLALARRLKFSVFRNSHSVHIPNHGHREVFHFFFIFFLIRQIEVSFVSSLSLL